MGPVMILQGRQRQAYELFDESPRGLTTAAIAERLACSRQQAQSAVRRLKEKGAIRYARMVYGHTKPACVYVTAVGDVVLRCAVCECELDTEPPRSHKGLCVSCVSAAQVGVRKLIEHFGSQMRAADFLGYSAPTLASWIKGAIPVVPSPLQLADILTGLERLGLA